MRFLVLAAASSLCPTAAALADTGTSSNWSGYVAHASGVAFRSVSAQWRVPTASCASTSPGFSSIWVGLGGYSGSSNALEQAGVEIDCSRSGRATYSGWYELVPAPVQRAAIGVRPGDLVRAEVTATGREVTIRLQDLTRHPTFERRFTPASVDLGSADWIVEAPSECDAYGNCRTLPLADFGQAAFSGAQATTKSGRSAGITSRWWSTTSLTLVPDVSRFAAQESAGSAGEAIPSSLTAAGSAFTDAYQEVSASSQPAPSGPFFPGGP